MYHLQIRSTYGHPKTAYAYGHGWVFPNTVSIIRRIKIRRIFVCTVPTLKISNSASSHLLPEKECGIHAGSLYLPKASVVASLLCGIIIKVHSSTLPSVEGLNSCEQNSPSLNSMIFKSMQYCLQLTLNLRIVFT